MKIEWCEHVADEKVGPFATYQEAPNEDGFIACKPCFIAHLRSKGINPAQYVVGYNFYQSTDPNLPKSEWTKLNKELVPPGEQYNQPRSELKEGVTYYKYMTAVNGYGLETPPSNVQDFTLPAEAWPDTLPGPKE